MFFFSFAQGNLLNKNLRGCTRLSKELKREKLGRVTPCWSLPLSTTVKEELRWDGYTDRSTEIAHVPLFWARQEEVCVWRIGQMHREKQQKKCLCRHQRDRECTPLFPECDTQSAARPRINLLFSVRAEGTPAAHRKVEFCIFYLFFFFFFPPTNFSWLSPSFVFFFGTDYIVHLWWRVNSISRHFNFTSASLKNSEANVVLCCSAAVSWQLQLHVVLQI